MLETVATFGPGTRVTRLSPDRARAGVVLVPDAGGLDATLRDYAGRLVDRGYAVALPDLWWRLPAPPPTATGADRAAAADLLCDPEVLQDLASARAALGELRRVFVMGFSLGGLYARMGACAMLGFVGAVEFYGRVVYPAVGPRRPAQPLDLLPGLRCPIQCHFGSDDAVAPPAHVDDLEARLRLRQVGSQVFRYPGCAHGFLDPSSPAWRPTEARLAWARSCAFLDALAEG